MTTFGEDRDDHPQDCGDGARDQGNGAEMLKKQDSLTLHSSTQSIYPI